MHPIRSQPLAGLAMPPAVEGPNNVDGDYTVGRLGRGPKRKEIRLFIIAVVFICAVLTTYFVASTTYAPAPTINSDSNEGDEEVKKEGGRHVRGTLQTTTPAFKTNANVNTECDCGQREVKDAGTVGKLSVSLVSDTLTVVLMSYPGSSRFHLLKKIIERVTSWPFVYEVLLVWNGEESQIPADIRTLCDGGVEHGTVPADQDVMLGAVIDREKRVSDTSPNAAEHISSDGASGVDGRRLRKKPKLTALPQLLNRVDNRWRIGRRVRTQAVLNMDDDIDLRTDGAQCLFDVWQSSPSALVGIDVRSHFVHREKSGVEKGPFGPYGYTARDTSTRGVKKFSITLPRALLTSREHFLAYDAAWRNPTTKVKAIVDELLCDDIAFNFVANSHHTAPLSIYAKANYDSYPESNSAGAMVKKPGMKAKRQRCVNELSEALNMTLKHRYWHVLCSVDG